MKINPLTRILSGFQSIAKANENLERIEDAFENTLSRDGTTPNAMQANLDMGSNRIVNVGPPVDLNDAVRLQDVLDLESGEFELNASWDNVTDKPTEFPPEDHTHVISDVTGLQGALDGKQVAGSYASSTHGHAIADTTGLQDALDSKAATSHTHAITDVINLQTSLNARAFTSHSHAISDTTGLQTALDGKASTSHTHTSTNISDFTEAVQDVVGAQLVAGTNVTVSYNDGTGQTTISSTGGGGGGASLDLSNTTLQVASTAEILSLPNIINRELTFLKFIPYSQHAAILSRTATVSHAAYIQEAMDEAEVRGGAEIIMEEGLFRIDRSIIVPSNTRITGKGAASEIQSYGSNSDSLWVDILGGIDPGYQGMFINKNYTTTELTDHDIEFSNMTITHHRNKSRHVVTMWKVLRPRVTNVHIRNTGGSCTAFLGCHDSLIFGSYATNAENAGFDHWHSPFNNKVIGCTVRDVYGQGIQFTASNTEQNAGTAYFNMAANNHVYNCGNPYGDSMDWWSGGIVSNGGGTSAQCPSFYFKSINNNIDSCQNGLILSGPGRGHISDNDTFTNCTVRPIRIWQESSPSGVPGYCTIKDPQFENCTHKTGFGLITVEGGSENEIKGMQVYTGTYTDNIAISAAAVSTRIWPFKGINNGLADSGTSTKNITLTGW